MNRNPRILFIAILRDLEDMNYYLFWFEVMRLECTAEWSALTQCVSAHSDFLRWQIKYQYVLVQQCALIRCRQRMRSGLDSQPNIHL